ncbi:MAG: DNA-directed RNA polymerase subunit beta, partial [Caulobacteraceae bacterium]
MAQSFTGKKRIRLSFGRIPEAVQMPNLIEVQRSSYEQFLQREVRPAQRRDEGIEAVFKSVFPIKDFNERAMLEYVSYEFEDPKYDVEECIQRDMTYAAPLKVKLRLIVWEIDEETQARSVKDIKEQDVYMGDIPLMTDKGTFVVNGTERVIVSQMHRSPGVFFDHDKGKSHSSGKLLFAARIIPYRGSWLDFEFDAKDVVFCRIDRRRKLPATTFLYALGMDGEEILTTFYDVVPYVKRDGGGWATPYKPERWRGVKPEAPLIDGDTGEEVAPAGTKISARQAKRLADGGLKTLLLSPEALVGRYLARDEVNPATGEIYAEAGDELDIESIASLEEHGFTTIDVLDIDHVTVGAYIRNTLRVDKNATREDALFDVYRVMRPGEPPTIEAAEAMFKSLFFDKDRYDLSSVGRVKMNIRLELDCPDDVRVIRKEDVLEVLKTLVGLRDGRGEIDDIDNLGNRRVRSVGELLENQYRVGLLRMERAIKERMSSVDIDTVMPHDLINAKPAAASVREFFGSSQLSQFMDQTNPLSEITHKRRLSALGPGGLTRERAGFEVRDVHPTHYGRICPIETPEGPNIGLINSLATHAVVNKYGFIESPYRRVKDGKITDEVVYMSAMEEAKHVIAQANIALKDGEIVDDLVPGRINGEPSLLAKDQVDLMDVSPKQVVSVAAALIPFLENDDANRALMGSNMQRQAVPLIQSDAPLVGTGMEDVVARDSGAVVIARRPGVVEQIDGTRIVIRATEETDPTKPGVDIYRLSKFQRSNQNTCINQRPLVRVGDKLAAGDIIADGPSTDLGELALGRNALVAFMPWNGYNFEDSILISERIVRDDVFTSIHIEEFEVMARDTKLGPEEITRDIPNVGEEALRNLDEAGIVAIGAEVLPGDILVGKVTPKGESPMTPEEKLLRAIFGEKASDVRDTSLRLPPGVAGTVVEVRVFNRHGVEKDERAVAIEREEIDRLGKDRDDEFAILNRNMTARLRELLVGANAVSGPKGLGRGEITPDKLEEIAPGLWWQIAVEDEKAMGELEAMRRLFDDARKRLDRRFEDKVDKLQRGDEMPPGVMKMVKVFVAVKRKLQPGDKMAGRHGNKGVISKILPIEDMPHLEDGTPVDVVLNPLGVPSRMNVGQIFETHLGWACAGLGRQIGDLLEAWQHGGQKKALTDRLRTIYGKKQILPDDEEELIELARNLSKGVPIATPVFDGAHIGDIENLLEAAGLSRSGQVMLY